MSAREIIERIASLGDQALTPHAKWRNTKEIGRVPIAEGIKDQGYVVIGRAPEIPAKGGDHVITIGRFCPNPDVKMGV